MLSTKRFENVPAYYIQGSQIQMNNDGNLVGQGYGYSCPAECQRAKRELTSFSSLKLDDFCIHSVKCLYDQQIKPNAK